VISSGSTVNAVSYLKTLYGNWTNSGTFTASTSTVNLAGTSKTLTGGTTYNNLTVSGSYTASSDVTVVGAMNITGSFAAGSTTTTFYGNFSNTGTFSSSGSVVFAGTGPQTIALNSGFASTGTVNFNGTISPTLSNATGATLTNVTINNTAGVTPGAAWTVG